VNLEQTTMINGCFAANDGAFKYTFWVLLTAGETIVDVES